MGKRLKKISVNGFVSELSAPSLCVAPEYRNQDNVHMECEIGDCTFEVRFVLVNANLDPAELFAAIRDSLGVNVDVTAKFQPKPIAAGTVIGRRVNEAFYTEFNKVTS